jgi:hypothetical protein
MAKRKVSSQKSSKADQNLMLLAGAAAIIVGFVAIFSYKSKSIALMPSPTPSVVQVNLDTQNNSYESGSATLQEISGKVVVTIMMKGYPKTIPQPAHIHIGSCPNPGSVKFPLSSVINGQSTTTIDTTLAKLEALGPLAINVHKSVSSSNIYVSCGDLKF